ncbi:MAG: type II toxin-antitoxin system RelE/ParE family toxin [bacterium]|nr:type II toxin-antitoxin system RelE/ParE family toxin [bacterium]
MADKIAKFIASLDPRIRQALKDKLLALQANPHVAKDVIKMRGLSGMYRLRMGKIRIIFTIKKSSEVEIIDIDYRGNIY